jgi:tetratricopeptide (TPR) repeat protein
MEQNRFEEAATALENATSGTSPAAYMWNNLGMAYEHLDRIREARAAYRQAATAGSARGQANVQRLEGVTSLRPAAPAAPSTSLLDTPHDALDELMGIEGDEGAAGGAGQNPQDEEPGC